MADCIFCKIIAGEIPSKKLMETESVIVINDIHPQAPVHMLVIPKKHALDIVDMSPEDYRIFMQEVRIAIETFNVLQFRLVHNGRGAQFVPHAHIHIMGSVNADRNL